MLCVHNDLQLVSQTCKLHPNKLNFRNSSTQSKLRIKHISKPQPRLIMATSLQPIPMPTSLHHVFGILLMVYTARCLSLALYPSSQ